MLLKQRVTQKGTSLVPTGSGLLGAKCAVITFVTSLFQTVEVVSIGRLSVK